MRFKIIFRPTEPDQLLPLNYKYPVSSWIYKILANSDKEFTAILHENGYKLENGKQFKFFTFSDFNVPKGKWKIAGDRMKIWSDEISLIVSFLLPEQSQNFVAGLFHEQEAVIGDKISQLHLSVQNITALNTDFEKQEVYTLQSQSPIFMQKKGDRHRSPNYISPSDPEYPSLFFGNLIDKYRCNCLNQGIEPKEFDESEIKLNSLTASPRPVKQIIKAFQKEETHLRAYKFNFELKAPKELVEIGLQAGFGASNSQGFGCCKIMNNQRN